MEKCIKPVRVGHPQMEISAKKWHVQRRSPMKSRKRIQLKCAIRIVPRWASRLSSILYLFYMILGRRISRIKPHMLREMCANWMCCRWRAEIERRKLDVSRHLHFIHVWALGWPIHGQFQSRILPVSGWLPGREYLRERLLPTLQHYYQRTKYKLQIYPLRVLLKIFF